jgi:hypothetical protein
MSSEGIDHLREEGGKIGDDFALEGRRQPVPELFRSDGHDAPLSAARAIISSTAATVSLVASGDGQKPSAVAAIGIRRTIRFRYSTNTWLPEGARAPAETIGRRRPNSGCFGSTTSISLPAVGLWKGVSTDLIVRQYPA